MALNTIWHNPKCAKSRTALKLLNDWSIDARVFYYLNEIINYEDLMSVVKKLSIPTLELVRTNEKIFRALGLTHSSNDEVLIQAMSQNPILIERPLVMSGERAVIGRPPERVLELFN